MTAGAVDELRAEISDGDLVEFVLTWEERGIRHAAQRERARGAG